MDASQQQPEESQWVSASRTRNWIVNDPLLDYLDMYCSDKPAHIPDIIRDGSSKEVVSDDD